MKKNTVKGGFLLMLCLGAVLTANAQTPSQKEKIKAATDTAALKAISERATARFEANYKRALELAEQNGWPLTIIDREKGSTAVLTGVRENGMPLYKETSNQGSVATARVDNIQDGGLFNYDLAGQDMTVGMWEIGYPRNNHNDFSGRISSGDGSSFTGDDSGPDEEGINFHATHVAGTMIGDGSSSASARGFAYEADMLAYDSFNDIGEAATAAGDDDNPLLISNHSYGFKMEFIDGWETGAYNADAADWDDIHHAAPYYQAVMAAGNDRTGTEKDELLMEKNAKNVIIVAAVYELDGDPEDVAMSNFSTWGPTDDRRIKPDISAKGVDVWSCSSASNSAHELAQGTSMASPAVASTLILLQQHYSDLHDTPMRAATLKALMTHTADDAGDNPGPDYKFGWGLINATEAVLLMDAADTAPATAKIIEDQVTPIITEYSFNVEVTGNDIPLRATLAWTDPAGPVNNGTANSTVKRLVNDLDLRIIKMEGEVEGEEVFFPWKLANVVSNAPENDGDNDVDNIEKVEILDPEAGTYKIKVTYKGDLDNFAAQKFSLIVDKFEGLAGTTDNVLATKLSVYPNPANDVLNINFDSSVDTSDCSISLYDVQGRQIKQFNKYVQTIDVSDLSAGIYMMNIAADGAKTTRKIVVE